VLRLPTPGPGLADRLLWLPLLGVALGPRAVTSGATLADLSLALFVAGSLLTGPRGRPRLRTPDKWLLAFAGLALLGAVLRDGGPLFSRVEFARSFLKLVFYGLSAAVLARHLERCARLEPQARRAFALAGALAIALWAGALLGVEPPHELVWGRSYAVDPALYVEGRWFGDGSASTLAQARSLRAHGLQVEPARFALLQALALGFLVLAGPLPALTAGLGVIVVSLLLSFSLVGLVLAAAIGGLLLVRLRWAGPLPGLRRLWPLLLGLLLLLALPPVTRALHDAVLLRLLRIASGQADASAFLRVTGSWSMALALARPAPWFGVGLGNFDVALEGVREGLPGSLLIPPGTQGWNVLAHVLATTGILGLSCFLGLLVSTLRRRPLAGLLFALALFGDGTFLGPHFWVFLVLYGAGWREPA
jgi:hypothetical protein